MNSPTDGGRPAGIDEIRSRIQELGEAFACRARRSERKFKLYIALGLALPIALSISLTMLTNMAFKLDAEALTQIGRHEVEKHLPIGRENMVALLKEKAPEITSQLIAGMVDSLPHLRPLVIRELDEKLRLVSTDFEDQLLGIMQTSIQSTKADLDQRFPGMSDAEKIDHLVTDTAAKFNARVEAVLEGLYPKYSAEMRRVEAYLTRLREKDPAQLTVRERSEKEIIETLLRLVALEHEGSTGG